MLPIKLIKNTKTNDVFLDDYRTSTLLNKYSENDFINLGMLFWYHYDVEKKPIAMRINVLKENALNIFSSNAQQYIINSIRPSGSSPQYHIDLCDFNKDLLSSYKFEDLINTISTKNLKVLENYRKTTGHITKNLLHIVKIKHTKLDLQQLFLTLSKEFDSQTNDITEKTLLHYQLWRNKYIKDTVRNFPLKKINRDFLSFLILHMFLLCEDEFTIYETSEIF